MTIVPQGKGESLSLDPLGLSAGIAAPAPIEDTVSLPHIGGKRASDLSYRVVPTAR